MTIPVDTSKDWELVEGLEDVEFFRRLPDEKLEPVGFPTKGKRMPLTLEDMEGDERLPLGGLVWHMWTDLLGDRRPVIADAIKDAGGNWYYSIKVDVVSNGNRFRCICLKDVRNG